MDERIELVLGTIASFDISHTLCFKEILMPPKVRLLSCGTLSQTLNLAYDKNSS